MAGRARENLLVAFAQQHGFGAAELADQLVDADTDVVLLPLADIIDTSMITRLTTSVASRDAAVILVEGNPNHLFLAGLISGLVGIDRTLLVSVGSPTRLPDLGAHTIETSALDEHTIKRIVHAIDQARRRPRAALRSAEGTLSCFISYSSPDRSFAERLATDLTDSGFSSWLDSHQLKAGDRWADEIRTALARSDRVIVVLSEHSASSRWVAEELRLARQAEVASDRKLIYPVSIDSAVFSVAHGPIKELVDSVHIADFADWRNDEAYAHALRRFVKDLVISSSTGVQK